MPHIQIIEDDALFARLYEKAFGFEGYDVEVATNGREGLEKVKTGKPTLILLDIMMPEMNGLEVLDHLKSDDATKDIPVIVLTNLAGEKDAEEALAKGAVKYIVKSDHDPKEIVSMVKGILAGYTRDELPPVV
ncbi:MAG: response regulator [Candidatus Andersenbacteria bacterium]|nr:response regulator [bacterium]MDZ4225590.1 response regulator [Candidatus Andersenbacteria bacterium]